MEIKASCVYDLKTITALNRASLSKGKSNPKIMLILWSIFTVLYITAIIMMFDFSEIQTVLRVLIAIVVIFELFLLYCYFLLPKRQYKIMASTANTKNIFVFEENKFSVSTNSEELSDNGVFYYTVLLKAKETKDYLFLYIRKNSAFIIDKSTFENGTIEDIQKILKPLLGKKYVICNY